MRGESALDRARDSSSERGIEQVIGDEPTPEFAVTIMEEYERLLVGLGDETLRTVAQLKFEGNSNAEIAQRLECSLRTVERKLWVIRRKWTPQDLADE